MLLKCECLNGSRLELTWVHERRHGPMAPHTGSGFVVMWLTFRTATGELVKSGNRLYVEVVTIRVSISEFEVFTRFYANQSCLLESTRRWVELQSCMVTEVSCCTGSRMLRRKIEAWIQKDIRSSQQTQEEQEEHTTIQCEMMRWILRSSWFLGCHVSLLTPVQDRSPNTS